MRVRDIVRFGVVGTAQNLLNVAVFAALVAGGTPYLLAAVVAAAVAMVASFFANRRWTFSDAQERTTGRQLSEYSAIFVTASLAALAVLAFLTEVGGVPKVAAQALALMTIAPLSFLAQRLITFRA